MNSKKRIYHGKELVRLSDDGCIKLRYNLKQINHCQAWECLNEEGNIYLLSYETFVLRYFKDENFLECSGLYSATTRKHISRFLKHNFNRNIDYYDIKALVYLGEDWVIKSPYGVWYYYNMLTGEVLTKNELPKKAYR